MYDCPNCGGPLRFDIRSQTLRCDHCDTRMDPYAYGKEHDADETTDAYGVTVYTCPQCGGEIMTTNMSVTGFCSYCGASTVLDGKMRDEKRPDYIIPFQVTGEDCRASYRKRMRRAFFAPRELTDPAALDRFRGIYMPYWVYSAKMNGRAHLEGEKTYRRGDYMITDHYALEANLDASYRGVSYDASSSFSDDVSQSIAPFRAESMKPFTPSILCGFYADTSDVSYELYEDEAAQLAEQDCYKRLTRLEAFGDVGVKKPGDRKSLRSAIREVPPEKPALALFPVWFSTYRKGDRVAYSVINGESGQIAADLPISVPRYLAGSLLLAIPLFLVLNFFLTLTPQAALTAAALLSVLSSFLYYMEARGMADRELRTHDRGYQEGVRKRGGAPGDREGGMPRSGKKDKGDSRALRAFAGAFAAAVCFVVLFVLMSVGSLSGLVSILVLAAPVGAAVCTGLSAGVAGKVPGAHILRGALPSLAAAILAALILFLDPASDLYYYGGAVLVFLAVGISVVSLIRRYNILATRPLPDFFDRKGGETGKAMLSIGLALTAGALLLNPRNALAAGASYTNPATGYGVFLQDDADLLSDAEEQELAEDMEKITAYGSAAFVTTLSNGGSAKGYAEKAYLSLIGRDDGCLFLIDMEDRIIYIYAGNRVRQIITTSRANTIADNVYRMAGTGDYLGCAREVFAEVYTLLEGGTIAQPMKYASNALLSLIMALMINYLIASVMSRTRKPSDQKILGAVQTSFMANGASAVRTHTSRIYDPPSRSSGGGGGGSRGGGGGGGGFSGGGGGHRF